MRQKKKEKKTIWRNNGCKRHNLEKDIKLQIQEGEQIPNRIYSNKYTKKIIMKVLKIKDKEKILKSMKGKLHPTCN